MKLDSRNMSSATHFLAATCIFNPRKPQKPLYHSTMHHSPNPPLPPSPVLFFEFDAIERLIDHASFHHLRTLHSTRRHLRSLAEDVTELGDVLALYPSVLSEPLDSHYRILQSLRALQTYGLPLAEQMALGAHGYRGLVWMSFLASLTCSPEMRPAIFAALDSYPSNRYACELALARIDGICAPPHHEAWTDLDILAKAYQVLPLKALGRVRVS